MFNALQDMLKMGHKCALSDEIMLFEYTKYFTAVSKHGILKRKFCIPGARKCCLL
jgi:hypothetical protein